MTSTLLGLLLETNLAAAAAILFVLAIRKPVRNHLGPHAAYLLWALVPTAVAATFIPSRIVIASGTISLPGESPPVAASVSAATTDTAWLAGFTPLVVLLWGAGVGVMAYILARRQDLFTADMASGKAGPAVVGFVHSRIVTPDDFLTRFDHAERSLILAHEKVHLERHDARINAVVAFVRCVFWFNPLVHVGARSMRIDQELSCDATVIEYRPRARKAYAETLLKTQLAPGSLPVGCYWPAGAVHPLMERIAMLARTPFSQRRRLAATAGVLALTLASGLTAWAAQPERTRPADTIEAPPPHADDTYEVLVPIQPLGPDGHLVMRIYSDDETLAQQHGPVEVDGQPPT